MKSIQKAKGFTLIELIIVLTIILLLALSALSFGQYWLPTIRADAALDQLYHALQYARSEAIFRGETVTFCGSANKQGCDGQWSAHLLLFVDRNANQRIDAGDELLRIYPPLSGKASWNLRAFPTSLYLRLKPKGYDRQQNGTFIYCSKDHDPHYSRGLVISKSGRIRVIQDEVERHSLC